MDWFYLWRLSATHTDVEDGFIVATCTLIVSKITIHTDNNNNSIESDGAAAAGQTCRRTSSRQVELVDG